MDVFSGTFHQAADTGSALPAANRHLPIFRSCVDPDDAAVLAARCSRPGTSMRGDYFLLLTRRRLVVTRESRMLHRRRLHLNAYLRHLSNVSWRLDLAKPAIEIAATAVDGVRERFRLRLPDAEAVWAAEELLRQVFHGPRREPAAPATVVSRRSAAPAAALA